MATGAIYALLFGALLISATQLLIAGGTGLGNDSSQVLWIVISALRSKSMRLEAPYFPQLNRGRILIDKSG